MRWSTCETGVNWAFRSLFSSFTSPLILFWQFNIVKMLSYFKYSQTYNTFQKVLNCSSKHHISEVCFYYLTYKLSRIISGCQLPGYSREWFWRLSVHLTVVYPRHSRTWHACCAGIEPLLSFPEKMNLLHSSHTF